MKALYVFFASLLLIAGMFFASDKPETAETNDTGIPADERRTEILDGSGAL